MRSTPPAASTRRRTEASGSRYTQVLLVLIICWIVFSLLINIRFTSYFETISATIDQASTISSAASEDVSTAALETPEIDARSLNPSPHREAGLTIHNAAAVELPNEKKIQTTGFGPGQFCSFCQLTKDLTCARRLEFLMSKYGLNETAAKASLVEKCTTPMIPHNVYTMDNEPSFILHVGPHKTATTALQSFIYDIAKLSNNPLLKDNLRIPLEHELPGFFSKEGVGLNLAHCSIDRYKSDGGKMGEAACGSMIENFSKFVADAYNKSQNILVVAEDFDRPVINFNRLHFFLQPYKKIKVISTYRRLHDWLPSWYNQIVDHYKEVSIFRRKGKIS